MMNEWKILSEGNGNRLAIEGPVAVAAMHGRLAIWVKDELMDAVERPFVLPGFPCIGNDRIFWGDGYYDLTNRKFEQRFHIEKTAFSSADRIPGEGFMPVTYAWHREGKLMAASFYWSGAQDTNPSQVILVNYLTGEQKIIWREKNAPPSAIHISRSFIILGTREPAVMDHTGKLLFSLKSQVPPFRVCCTENEEWLMIAEYGSVAIWNMQRGELYKEWKGQWLDAAISPNGEYLVLVDFDGNFHVCRPRELNVEAKLVKPPDPVQSIALSNEVLIASFAKNEKIRISHI